MTLDADIDTAKRSLRAEMRAVRNALTDRSERSARICSTLLQRSDIAAARRIMVFDSVPGEPETVSLIEQLRGLGKEVALPEDAGLDPAWPDVIILPGLAFTADGARLGQGGGWYDRFLPGRRANCVTIGVCFAPLLLDNIPTNHHDVTLDAIVTDG